MLKAQLNQTTSALEKLKAESALTKQKHIKWEDEQSGKLRNYREARREWQNQMANTEHQVKDYEMQLNEQKVQLDSARQQIFELENELKTLEPTLNKMTENEHRVKQLTQQMLLWEEDTSHMEEQKRYIKGLLSQWWSMEELVASLQTENRRLQEEQIQKQESLEKLKVESINYQQKIESFSKTFNNERGAIETERLQNTLNELKTRLEELEVIQKYCCRILINVTNSLKRLKNWNGVQKLRHTNINPSKMNNKISLVFYSRTAKYRFLIKFILGIPNLYHSKKYRASIIIITTMHVYLLLFMSFYLLMHNFYEQNRIRTLFS